MKVKSIYRAAMTREQAEIVKILLQNHLDTVKEGAITVEKMREVVAVSDVIAQLDDEFTPKAA